MTPAPTTRCVDCGEPATIIRTAPDGDDYETRRWVEIPLCAVCDAATREVVDGDEEESEENAPEAAQ